MRLGRRMMGVLAVFLLPYVVTLAWSGGAGGVYGNGMKGRGGASDGWPGGTGGLFGGDRMSGWGDSLSGGAGDSYRGEQGSYGAAGRDGGKPDSGQVVRKKIYIGSGQQGYLDVETYLIGIVARQIPAEYGLEALKAQAIIARTYILGQMEGKTEIKEEELGLKYLEEEQMESLWGRQNFVEYYDKISQAVRETGGLVMVLDEGEEQEEIHLVPEPMFHRASAGYTRDGGEGYPYLKSVASPRDVEAEGYLTVTEWEPEEVIRLMKEGAAKAGREEQELTKEQVMDTVQLVSRDGAGYVKEIQIGAHIYTGDEIRLALGLPSAAFTLEEHEGMLRAVCKGIGHGYGLSQKGADAMAEEGKNAEEILKYYYQNIIIISCES